MPNPRHITASNAREMSCIAPSLQEAQRRNPGKAKHTSERQEQPKASALPSPPAAKPPSA
jgi:hypothetical protein